MKTNNSLPSSKSLISIDTKKIINIKCKQDHFTYKKQLPPKKNLSSYSSAYHDFDPKKIAEKVQTQKYRDKIAPASLDNGLLKRSLYQSTIHFSNHSHTKLPSLNVGSTYNRSFHEKSNEKIVKGKQQSGFFIKMPWHENPVTNYKKSFEVLLVQNSQSLQKGKPRQDHINIIKSPFKAFSNYEESFKSLKKNVEIEDSSHFIKSKDHLIGVNFPLTGQSEYKRRFENSQNTENHGRYKKNCQRKQKNVLPEIKPARRYQKENREPLAKKSITMQKTQSCPQEQSKQSIKISNFFV